MVSSPLTTHTFLKEIAEIPNYRRSSAVHWNLVFHINIRLKNIRWHADCLLIPLCLISRLFIAYITWHFLAFPYLSSDFTRPCLLVSYNLMLSYIASPHLSITFIPYTLWTLLAVTYLTFPCLSWSCLTLHILDYVTLSFISNRIPYLNCLTSSCMPLPYLLLSYLRYRLIIFSLSLFPLTLPCPVTFNCVTSLYTTCMYTSCLVGPHQV